VQGLRYDILYTPPVFRRYFSIVESNKRNEVVKFLALRKINCKRTYAWSSWNKNSLFRENRANIRCLTVEKQTNLTLQWETRRNCLTAAVFCCHSSCQMCKGKKPGDNNKKAERNEWNGQANCISAGVCWPHCNRLTCFTWLKH